MNRLIGAAIVLQGLLTAATTAVWEMNTYSDFLRGKLTGVSLNRDGRLALAPKLDTVFGPDQPQIWALARGADGAVYIATGHRGRLYRVDPSGAARAIWSAEQPEVFALAVDGKGAVYAGSSPDGKIYKIEGGKALEYFAPGAKYIWALAIGPDGALFAGTGDQGRIYRITAQGKGELYYESGQSNITCLAFDSSGRLLAGSEPNGILYRITAAGKAFVLYDSNLPEIRSILPMPDGTIYVAALGGSLTKKAGAAGAISSLASGTVVTAPGTTITVTDTQAGFDLKQKPDTSPKAVVSSSISSGTLAASQAYEVAGVEKSAVYRIQPDNAVETIFSSKDENIYDLATAGDALLFSTDGAGRVYRLHADRKATLVEQLNEGEAARLLADPREIYAASGGAGRLYRIGSALAEQGEYESPVHDAGTVSRWGRLSWRTELNGGGKIVFRTRTGNSSRVDNTWSDWSEPMTESGSGLITSPNARFLQWKAVLSASKSDSPYLYSVTAAYLPQNTAPVVRSVSVSAGAATSKSAAASPGGTSNSSTSSSFSVNVTDTPDAAQQQPAGTPSQAVSRGAGQQLVIQWQADDPEGDRLAYTLYYRGEDEKEWKLLRGGMFENSFTLDADVLADGRYLFRVIASDKPSNPAAYARESDGTSAPVLIDNTPPVVSVAGVPRRNGPKLEIDVDAVDQTTPLRRCEYSIDAASWIPLEAADGVTDSLRERFELRLEDLKPGEHVVVFRAYDSAGNAGLTKVIVR
jgi:hypothetical protein